jgi:hypothetical protein
MGGSEKSHDAGKMPRQPAPANPITTAPTAKRFWIADDHGNYYWLGVAVDREHFVTLLRMLGAQWEVEIDGHYAPDQGIDRVIEIGLVEVRELTADILATKYRRCHTEDERGVIPLTDARIGDLFCSEW